MGSEIFSFLFPDIGEGVVEGEVVTWLKQVGDAVKQDEPVVVVMTDKATVELPAPHPGIIAKHYYAPGQMAIKDKPLYDIAVDKGVVSAKAPEVSQKKTTPSKHQERPVVHPQGKALATPKVRGIAKELGINLAGVRGTGADGRVLVEDLQGRSGVTVASMEGDTIKPLTGMRGVMARKMHHRDVPQFTYFENVEVTRLIQLRHHVMEKAKEEEIHLSYMPFFIRALSLTMREYPIVNSSVDMEHNSVIYHKHHNIGIATASEQGLVVPVLKDVDAMDLSGIIHAYDTLKKAIVGGKVAPEALKGATVTISNFGVLGGDGSWATPLVNPPEVAIMAVARIRKDPVVRNGEVVVRDVLPLSWSFDHRVIDGELAAKISHHYCTLLRDPATLL